MQEISQDYKATLNYREFNEDKVLEGTKEIQFIAKETFKKNGHL